MSTRTLSLAIVLCFAFDGNAQNEKSVLPERSTRMHTLFVSNSGYFFQKDEKRLKLPYSPLLAGYGISYRYAFGTGRFQAVSFHADYMNTYYKRPNTEPAGNGALPDDTPPPYPPFQRYQTFDVQSRTFSTFGAWWNIRIYENRFIRIEGLSGMTLRTGKETVVGADLGYEILAFSHRFLDPGLSMGLRAEYKPRQHFLVFASAFVNQTVYRLDKGSPERITWDIPEDTGSPMRSVALKVGIGYAFGKPSTGY